MWSVDFIYVEYVTITNTRSSKYDDLFSAAGFYSINLIKVLFCYSTYLFIPSNVGEALVAKGLATVIRYRQDDDQRSSKYDDLLSAEARANKNSKGLHSKKDYPLHRVADLAGVSAFGVCYDNE